MNNIQLDEEIKEENNNINNEENNEKKKNHIFGFLLFLIILAIIIYFFNNNSISLKYMLTGKLDVDNIVVEKYNSDDTSVKLKLYTEESIFDKELNCYFSIDKNISSDDKHFVIKNNECEATVDINDYYIILENSNCNILSIQRLSNYINQILDLNFNSQEIFLAIGEVKNVNVSIISLGKTDKNLKWSISNNNIAKIDNGVLTGLEDGKTTLTLSDSYGNSKNINVTVTNLINNLPGLMFNKNKKLLRGEVYTAEQAELLDKILAYRVEEAGESTRAGAVAAARFLTLEFKYIVPYFFENGRLNDSGTAFVDGEGRYYHKGLYLHKDKFKTIKARLAGPAIWGMPLTNYEDSGTRYIRYNKMPNGLDCSGFVSWAILNGGFDPGDYGAGENSEIPNQMTDLGDYTPITKTLLESGKVKAGDLINFWGHIGMIIGIDGDNYYVAETLDYFKGLEVKKYTKANIGYTFTHIVLMDSYYKQDGNYTEMW